MAEMWKVACEDGQERDVDPIAVRDLTLAFMEDQFNKLLADAGLAPDASPEEVESDKRAYITGYVHGLRDLVTLFHEMAVQGGDESDDDA